MRNTRILVAMSGGVDSSVAAALLVEAGHEVVGVTMRTFCYSETDAPSKTCCGLEGIADARQVADRLGIPHYVFDVEEDFTRDVIDDFVSEYARGRTPNPCVRCNATTKFPDLMERGRALGCDAIASGHYVRVVHSPTNDPALYRGADPEKDQSYFLWGLPKRMLHLLRFPLGNLTKREVRQLAGELDLITADKPESQEICFVPTGDYRALLRTRLQSPHPALQPGTLVTSRGEVVGEHGGYANFTVGQRKGLGGGFDEPLYVTEIRAGTREVVVGPRHECVSRGLEVGEINWLGDPPTAGARVRVQIRYRAPEVPATAVTVGDTTVLTFEEPQHAVTPGQSAVLFDRDRVLGGGRIARGLRAEELAPSAVGSESPGRA